MWKHNCSKCTFLGTFDRHDLYYCNYFSDIMKNSLPGEKKPGPTVIARYGSKKPEYKSLKIVLVDGLISLRSPDASEKPVDIHLREAYFKASQGGLVKK